MIVTTENFHDVLVKIQNSDVVALDLETTGLNPFKRDMLVGIAIAVGLDPYYFPFRHGSGYNLPSEYMKSLLDVLFNVKWRTWNGKFDLKFMRKEYFRCGANKYPPECQDVMLASHLLDENQPDFKLKSTGDRLAKYLGMDPKEASREQALLDKYLMDHGMGHGEMWKAPSEIVAPYAEQDVILTQKLYYLFEPALHRWQLFNLWQELNDYLIVIAKMEERGIKLDMDKVQQNVSTAVSEASRCLAEVRELSGIAHLNPNSAKIFKAYLNTELMIGYGTSITGTDVNILEGLMSVIPPEDKLHSIISKSVEYRRWVKANSTYYQAFLHFQTGGVVHPNLHMTGTVTGRFSSSDPNMQAIPRKDDEWQPKSHVKEVFVSRPGYWLVQIDYKMAEIFIGTHIAKAKNMRRMLEDRIDIHAETAKMMNIIRSIGKRLNFAVMYGIGPRAFVEDIKNMVGLDITLAQAEHYIAEYNKVHPEMRKMYHDLEMEAKTAGFIRMLTGRVRRYNGSEHYSKDGYKPSPYHKASSNMVQGSVAEVMRIASTRISHELGNKAHQLLHVHDSIILEVEEGDLSTIHQVEEIMCLREVNGVPLTVPMRVDTEAGNRWSELKPLKEVEHALSGR